MSEIGAKSVEDGDGHHHNAYIEEDMRTNLQSFTRNSSNSSLTRRSIERYNLNVFIGIALKIVPEEKKTVRRIRCRVRSPCSALGSLT